MHLSNSYVSRYREASSISDNNVWGIKDETFPMHWGNYVIRTVKNGHHVETLSRTPFDEESVMPGYEKEN